LLQLILSLFILLLLPILLHVELEQSYKLQQFIARICRLFPKDIKGSSNIFLVTKDVKSASLPTIRDVATFIKNADFFMEFNSIRSIKPLVSSVSGVCIKK
jgi:hypothetical protein